MKIIGMVGFLADEYMDVAASLVTDTAVVVPVSRDPFMPELLRELHQINYSEDTIVIVTDGTIVFQDGWIHWIREFIDNQDVITLGDEIDEPTALVVCRLGELKELLDGMFPVLTFFWERALCAEAERKGLTTMTLDLEQMVEPGGMVTMLVNEERDTKAGALYYTGIQDLEIVQGRG